MLLLSNPSHSISRESEDKDEGIEGTMKYEYLKVFDKLTKSEKHAVS